MLPSSRWGWALFLVFLVGAPGAWAQSDEDLLAPLTPTSPKTTKVKKKKEKKKKEVEAPVVASKGELLVRVAPGLKGAKLLIDDGEVGLLPLSAQTLSPGEHTVVVRRLGYADFVKRVVVAAGKTVEVNATLEPVSGIVAIVADRPGARVLVDGQEAGTAPTELLLPPGQHEVTLRKDGFDDNVQRLAVKAGKDYNLNVQLVAARAPSPADTPLRSPEIEASMVPVDDVLDRRYDGAGDSKPLYARWYVWAGAAAVVAAGVATGVVVSSSRPPPSYCGKNACDAVEVLGFAFPR